MCSRYAVAAMALSLAAVGCGDSSGPVDVPRPSLAPCSLEVLSGDGQAGPAGSPFADPLVVRVTDTEGRGMKGSTILWAKFDGNFKRGWTTRTDEEGVSETEFTPLAPGSSPVTASTTQCESSPVAFGFDVRRAEWLATGQGTVLVYEEVRGSADPTSRFVLEPDSGTLRLQFRSCCFAFEYTGSYTVEGDRIHFSLTGYRDSSGGSGDYSGAGGYGTIEGTLLTVEFEGDAYWDFGGLGPFQLVP